MTEVKASVSETCQALTIRTQGFAAARPFEKRNRALLAAVLYEADFRIDELMLAIAHALQAEGMRLRGVVQENASNLPCSVMSLVDLATGERLAISQDLGALARGCRLDPHGLAAVAARIDATINVDFDLLILNKFGKAEAEGNGLRNVLAGAISGGKPVLSAVRPPYLEAWSGFHGGLAVGLVPRVDAVVAWCRGAIRAQHIGPSVVA